ncbi:MAG TPA: hypothetical protein VF101_05000 [Gaiellaceae bacterium]
MTTPLEGERQRPADVVAGFLSAASIFVSLVGLAYRPVRLIPFAVLLALISAGIGGRNARLAAFATAAGALCFAVGLTLAILTGHPIY